VTEERALPAPAPVVSPHSAAFWEASAHERFLVGHCPGCDQWFWPPNRTFCPRCGKAAGLLQNFLPEHEILKFRPEDGKSAVTIAFSGLLTLQLLDAVRNGGTAHVREQDRCIHAASRRRTAPRPSPRSARR